MDQEKQERIRYYAFAAFVGLLLVLNATGLFKTIFGIDTAIIVTLLAGYKTFYNSISALLEKRISADIALCVAVIAALTVGEYLAAAEAMFIVLVGEGLESYAAGRTAAAIERLAGQLPAKAHLLVNGNEEEIDANLLMPDDRIVVRAGERIPADGIIDDGFSAVNESSITGEPLPKEKQNGDEVFCGSLNGNGLLRIRVTRSGPNTALAHVIELVKDAEQKRAPVERLADRAAKYFLPALLLAAALTFYFTRDWLRTVAVLVVACPCALILATPTAMVAAIGGLARRGILVRGAAVLERAAKIDTVVFDKTGTITEGQFEVVRLIAANLSETELLAVAAAAERASDHPLARVIIEHAARLRVSVPEPESAEVLPGRGARCHLNGRVVIAGSAAFMEQSGVTGAAELFDEAGTGTAVYIAQDGQLSGAILLRDRIRQGAREAVDALKVSGVETLVMLTGDRRRAAEAIAREVGIPQVFAELLPEQKVEQVRALGTGKHRVAMVGDGINDAPALATAAVGIAVAGASDITAEAADIVYLPHSLDKLPTVFEVSRRAVRTAWQNIIFFAAIFNTAAVLLASTGRIGPVGAAVTHQLSSFLVMMNSLRLLRVERDQTARWRGLLDRVLAYLREAAERIEFDTITGWLYGNREHLIKPVLVGAAAFLVLNGFYSISPDENGIIERFGRKVLPNRTPGLHYKLPWPIEKLTRIQAHRVRVIEIGFRSNATPAGVEPEAYEWNVQHRNGRYQRVPEESLMLTGDQNMIELNAVVHYSPEHPDDFLFRQLDGDITVRAAAESVLESMVTATPLDDVLTSGRQAMEARAQVALQARLDRYTSGVRVLRVKLEDVHPSLEVVDAFREVSGAFEEKNRLINEAEGYRNEQVSLARGNREAVIRNADAYRLGRVNRAGGDATRFNDREEAFRGAPQATESRLYLETMEEVLPGKKKLIIDKSQAKRHLLLLEDGVEIPPALAPLGINP